MNTDKQMEILRGERRGAINKHVFLSATLLGPLWFAWKRLKKKFRKYRHKKREPVFFLLWLIWLFAGSVFFAYAPRSNLGFVKGFYMAINIGYSIGFGYPTEEYAGVYLWFSSVYVLLGASFVGVALSFFAEKIAADTESWFTKMQQQKLIEEAIKSKHNSFRGQVKAWIYHNSSAVKAVSVWLGFITAMITYTMIQVKWSFMEAQYFAISTLSTGGHWPIPMNSPTWMFGVTGLFTMFGVPVMGVAMAKVAQVLISQGSLDEAKESIDAVVTKEEVEFLHELGLENFDGEIDKADFIILCMVRMGTDAGLIKYITQRFAELNFYTGRSLTVAEITQGACKFVDGRIRRAESVAGGKLNIVSERDSVIPDHSQNSYDFSHIKPKTLMHDGSADSCGKNFSRVRYVPTTIIEHHVGDPSVDEEAPMGGCVDSEIPSSGHPTNKRVSLKLEDVFQKEDVGNDRRRRPTRTSLKYSLDVAPGNTSYESSTSNNGELLNTEPTVETNQSSTSNAGNLQFMREASKQDNSHCDGDDFDIYMDEMEEGRSDPAGNSNQSSLAFETSTQSIANVGNLQATEASNHTNNARDEDDDDIYLDEMEEGRSPAASSNSLSRFVASLRQECSHSISTTDGTTSEASVLPPLAFTSTLLRLSKPKVVTKR